MVEFRQCVGNAAVFVLKRSPHDLGRMGGHHELDAQAAHRAVQVVRRHTGREQARQRFLDRGRLGSRARVALIGAAAAHAVVLLGDVGQVEEVRKAPRNRERRLDRHRAELAGQCFESIRRRHACAFGERAHALDALEERLAFLPAQRLAQQFAEQAHVVAEGAMRVGSAVSHPGDHLGHPSHLAGAARMLTTAPSCRRIPCCPCNPWL